MTLSLESLESWSNVSTISVPDWVIERQQQFQSEKYLDDNSRMEFVFLCAQTNSKLTDSAPLAAAVFTSEGELLSLGVDAEGVGGHEMTNALILASNLEGSAQFRTSADWDLFSLAPPCSVCLGNIFSERPRRFVHAVMQDDLLSALHLPNTPMPSHDWVSQLRSRGVIVEGPMMREHGINVLKSLG